MGERSSEVLPEILVIIDQMITLYNDWEGTTTYLKLECNRIGLGESPTSARYVLYHSKVTLLEAIKQNCPAGCSIIC